MKQIFIFLAILFVATPTVWGQATQYNTVTIDAGTVQMTLSNPVGNGRPDSSVRTASRMRIDYKLQNGIGSDLKLLLYAADHWFSGIDTSVVTFAPTFVASRRFPFVNTAGPITFNQTQVDSNSNRNWGGTFYCTEEEIRFFQSLYQPGISIRSLPIGIREWPANGNPLLGFRVPDGLADFVDIDGDSIYNPLNGDYPKLMGEKHAIQILNYTKSNVFYGSTLGIAPRSIYQKMDVFTLPSQNNSDVLSRSMFIKYTYINQSPLVYSDSYFGFWADPDLGNWANDVIGMNVMKDMAISYNGTAYDSAFGITSPLFGMAILDSPTANELDGIDNNKNGIVDEADEKLGCTAFSVSSIGARPKNGFPRTTHGSRNYLKGIWMDNSPFVYDLLLGTTRIGTNLPGIGQVRRTSYLYPGDSDPYGFGVGGSFQNPVNMPAWTEVNTSTYDGFYLSLLSTGPFSLQPRESKSITYALIASTPTAFDTLPSVYTRPLVSALDSVKELYRIRQQTPIGGKVAPNIVELYPNPATASIRLTALQPLIGYGYTIIDVMGRVVQAGKVSFVLDVSQLQRGSYYLRLHGAKTYKEARFVKQ